REYQASLLQHGNVTMRAIELWLICEEEATFTQGTDIRTETREVLRLPCFERRNFEIQKGQPFSDVCRMAGAISAMHSFQSAHNVVRWKLVVRGEAEKWPVFERGFPVVVYPGETTMQIEVGSLVARQAALPVAPTAAIAGAGA